MRPSWAYVRTAVHTMAYAAGVGVWATWRGEDFNATARSLAKRTKKRAINMSPGSSLLESPCSSHRVLDRSLNLLLWMPVCHLVLRAESSVCRSRRLAMKEHSSKLYHTPAAQTIGPVGMPTGPIKLNLPYYVGPCLISNVGPCLISNRRDKGLPSNHIS